MRHLKPILTFCLCLTVLVTSVTSAVARGQMATGQMVQICADGQAISVMVDADGTPIDAAHRCPDCLAVTAALPPNTADPARPAGRSMRLDVPAAALTHSRTSLHFFARGPPVLI